MRRDETGAGTGTLPFVLLGSITLCVLVLGLGLWAVSARITGAVVAPGVLMTDGPRHAVKHLRGGVVSAVEVTEGAMVGPNALLARLDSTLLEADLAYVTDHLFEIAAQQERLRAEYSGAGAVVFSDGLVAQARQAPAFEDILNGQRDLFNARAVTLARQTRQFRHRRAQITSQVSGIDVQLSSLSAQVALAQRTLTHQQALMERGAAPVISTIVFERDVLKLEAALAQLHAGRVEALALLEQIESEIAQDNALRRQEALSEMRALDQTIRKARHEAEHLKAEIAATALRAPVGGIVHGLSVEVAGDVLGAAEPLLYVIPQGQPRRIESRITPKDIDQIARAQPVKIRLSALNQRITPERSGRVSYVSADAIRDERTGERFFRVEIVLDDPAEPGTGGGTALLPGMPVEVFIQTGVQSPLGYLFQPIADYFARALRES